jgi:hypothetical protein
MTNIIETKESAPVAEVSPVSTPEPAADPAITAVAEKLADKPVEDLTAKELADLKFKIAEYEAQLKEVQSKYSESEKEASIYRSKAPLLSEVDGLSPEAIKALKNKDVWSLLDSAGIEEEQLYNELAKGRPQLSVEEKIRREIEKIQRADAEKAEREQKAIYEKRKVETMKTLSDWLDLTDVTKVDPTLHDAHEILRAAREEKDLAVEETLISLVEQSNISYAEAVKTLAEVIEKKVMKYTSIKALDSKIASRYKKEDTPAPAAPVDSKAKEVLKTIGDKVEEASKHVDTDSMIDRSSMDLESVLKSIKEKEKRKASNLRRL